MYVGLLCCVFMAVVFVLCVLLLHIQVYTLIIILHQFTGMISIYETEKEIYTLTL